MTMFQKLNISLLGVIENMSHYRCPCCGTASDLFGTGGGAILAKEYSTVCLEHLPLDSQVRNQSDQGKPIVLTHPEQKTSLLYKAISNKLVNILERTKKVTFPKVFVE